jgi:PAS domain-containing protein
MSVPETGGSFLAFADHATDAIARFDTDLRHVYVNPAVAQSTGVAADGSDRTLVRSIVDLAHNLGRRVLLKPSKISPPGNCCRNSAATRLRATS